MRKVIEASLIFRFLFALDKWLVLQWNQSRFIALAKSSGLRNIIAGSLVIFAISKLFALFSSQWKSSHIMTWFLSQSSYDAKSAQGVVVGVGRLVHDGISKAFEHLRLNKLLKNSIFTMPYLWAFLALIAAPLVPTMLLLPLALLCLMSLMFAFACDRDRKIPFSPVNKYIILFALIYIATTFTSVTFWGSIFGGALTTLFILFAIMISSSIKTKAHLDMLLGAFVISGTLVSLYGIYQYFFGGWMAAAWLDAEMFGAIGIRVTSTLENPNVLAMYLLLVIPFAAAAVINAKYAITRLFFIGCFLCMLACMVMTFARGGWLGLIVAGALFLVLIDRRFIILGIIALIALYFTLPEVILDRFFSIGDLEDTSTAFRVFIWIGTLAMLRDFWFTGIGHGIEAFAMIYPLYSFNLIISPHSHNLYLQIMTSTGFAGISMFVILLFSYFRYMFSAISIRLRSKVEAKSVWIIQIAAVCAIVGFLVQGFTDYSFYNYRITFVFWAVIGLGLAAARQSHENLGGEQSD